MSQAIHPHTAARSHDEQMLAILDALTALKCGEPAVRLSAAGGSAAFREVAAVFNELASQNAMLCEEIGRLSREVGKEGRLERRASLKSARGTWRRCVDCINSLIDDLVHPTTEVARVIGAVAEGDLSKSMALELDGRPLEGEFLRTAKIINKMVDQLGNFSAEVTRVAREVGTEGKLGGQAKVKGVAGTWKDLTDSVNSMAGNLTAQVRNIADVTTAVAKGDLSKKIEVDVQGEILELKDTINTMVDQLRSFAAEVTRVAREVGTEGELGGQADVQGVAGTWRDLTDSVNVMAGNLTSQVRGIAKVVTAVANGDLKQKLTVEAKGEVAALADTINSMTETLATFADQVTTVAREVGVEGKLGGQAKVPGAAGIWKGLTENVNELAANLTTQVRAIADVATAVTQGDLTRSITVETQGEVAALKDTINEMIRNLKDTTQKNTEQDWLKTNLAKFSRMLQGQRDLVTVGEMILSELAPVVGAHQAEFYVLGDDAHLELLASYASKGRSAHGKTVSLGEGLVGQCAIEKRKMLLENVAAETFRISTGLCEAVPLSVLIMPVIFEGDLRGVLELASLEHFNPAHQAFLDQLTESIGIVINTIEANTRTEDLLKQSQSLAFELQQTNQALEEKARQLALTSKYKSEFLANMSHELRTPLNSLLLLSDQLTKNPERNLTARQVEAAKTIHASGNDLLALINGILDLSKIESGTVMVDVSDLRLTDLKRYVERTFRHVAESKQVGFDTYLDAALPRTISTDVKRLQQIIKNLLSNAFKFTHEGAVSFSISTAEAGWSKDVEPLENAELVIALSVSDTGIGIAYDKQRMIFEAFQQADGSTSRKYGGTGLGLAISRELATLLGGEIRVVSKPGAGSTFTLFLPLTCAQRGAGARIAQAGLVATVAAPLGIELIEAGQASSPPARQGEPDDELGRAGAERRRAAGAGVDHRRTAGADHERAGERADDDRTAVTPGEPTVLVVGNDPTYTGTLLEAAHAHGAEALVAATAASALSMMQEHTPSLIVLDALLPDMQGWRVLDRLKADLSTRHIPVCVVSDNDERCRAMHAGAIGFIGKPVTRAAADAVIADLTAYRRRRRRLALLMSSPELETTLERLGGEAFNVTATANAAELCALLGSEPFDCLVVDARLAKDARDDLVALLEQRGDARPIAVVLFDPQGRDALSQWQGPWMPFVVREACSLERLMDTIYFMLHRGFAELSADERRKVAELHDGSRVLEGRKALIVDDDMRNIFALSTVLCAQGMETLSASDGHEAVGCVREDPSIDIVLMDIMMPDMDGIETMQRIRKLSERADLPIIAVTAKAMKGDRDMCIEAGAWDYLAKPVDAVHLLSVLRGWLHR